MDKNWPWYRWLTVFGVVGLLISQIMLFRIRKKIYTQETETKAEVVHVENPAKLKPINPKVFEGVDYISFSINYKNGSRMFVWKPTISKDGKLSENSETEYSLTQNTKP